MVDKTTLIAKKPTGLWNKEVSFNFKSLFKSLSEGAVAYFSQNNPDLIKSGISLIDAIEFKDKPEALLYSLVVNSFQQTIIEIINENIDKLNPTSKNSFDFQTQDAYQELIKDITEKIEEVDIIITIDFFNNPTTLNILQPLIEITKKWFIFFGFNPNDSINTSKKINSYFVYFLNDNWRKNSDSFQSILNKVITPFANATKIELEWKFYHSLLSKQAEAPVFNESFGLKDIFIDPYAYYEIEDTKSEIPCIERHVIDVSKHLNNWIIKTKNEEDTIKVISGGPGSGKSTFAKMYASRTADMNEIRVMYIPLQHFNIKDDLSTSLEEYIKESNYLQHNPLNTIHDSQTKILLIFDGLDELSKQGKHASELAKEFVYEVQRKAVNINREEIKLYIILTGRELTIQNQLASFRRPFQVVNLLPYYNSDTKIYIDKNKYLDVYLRDLWWNKYSNLKGLNYEKFPAELKSPRLDEITAQPLLNYLVALTYERKVVKFDDNTNLNEIFRDLIKAVFDRQYEKKQHKVITELNLSETNFLRVLEEIAISAWHSGDIRTTTIQKIEQHIENNNLGALFKEFQLGAQAGITRLLTAFYFRQKGIDADQNKTFEFTHKSFGEYLASRRIIGIILLLSKKIIAHDRDPDEGNDRKTALKKVIQILGVIPIDNYLFSFLSNEIKLYSIDEVNNLQSNIISLIEFAMLNGMPIELLSPRPEFRTELNYYRNSLLSLFVFLKISSNVTKRKSSLKWPTSTTLGEIITMLNIQKSSRRRRARQIELVEDFPSSDNSNSLMNSCLTNLIIKDCHLASADLTHADFSGSILKNVVFAGADLFGSSFIETTLEDVNFYRANIQVCVFKRATFIYTGENLNHRPHAEQLAQARVIEVTGLSAKTMEEMRHIKSKQDQERSVRTKNLKQQKRKLDSELTKPLVQKPDKSK